MDQLKTTLERLARFADALLTFVLDLPAKAFNAAHLAAACGVQGGVVGLIAWLGVHCLTGRPFTAVVVGVLFGVASAAHRLFTALSARWTEE